MGCQTAEIARRIASTLSRNGPTDDAYLMTLRTDGFALSDEASPTPCDAPVSFLTGRRDRVAGSMGLFNALGTYDFGSYATLSDAGHYLPFEQPDAFAAAMQSWLDRCSVLLDAEHR